ncbi:MAG: hypothetical protein ABW135_13480 [Thermoleophilaceae bacterium]
MTMPVVPADLEATAQRVKDQKILKNLPDLEEQAAKGTAVEWATALAAAHGNFIREASEVFSFAMIKQPER